MEVRVFPLAKDRRTNTKTFSEPKKLGRPSPPPLHSALAFNNERIAVLSVVEVRMDEHRVVAKHRLFLEREHVCDVHSWNGECWLGFSVLALRLVLREKYEAA